MQFSVKGITIFCEDRSLKLNHQRHRIVRLVRGHRLDGRVDHRTGNDWGQYKAPKSMVIGIEDYNIGFRGIPDFVNGRLQSLFRVKLLCQELTCFVELNKTVIEAYIMKRQRDMRRQQL